jgi:hypothetical protein
MTLMKILGLASSPLKTVNYLPVTAAGTPAMAAAGTVATAATTEAMEMAATEAMVAMAAPQKLYQVSLPKIHQVRHQIPMVRHLVKTIITAGITLPVETVITAEEMAMGGAARISRSG